MRARAANALWVATCLPEWHRFQRAAECVQETQSKLLSGYLKQDQGTEYGERFHFSTTTSAAQYQERVPLTTYDDYIEYIDRIAPGHPSVLTSESVRMFELSSGSTAASKLIPYTAGLKAAFQRGLAAWIYNLYTHMPDLQSGPAYWSITPLVDGARFSPAGIPIGFESDSAYLGLLGKWLVDSVMAVPNDVKKIADLDSFRYVTLLHLLRRADLRLISVWNPTFLSLLLASLPEWWDRLMHDVESGRTSVAGVELRLTPLPERALALSTLDPAEHGSLWPGLRLISCWADGASAAYARQLQKLFPRVELQGKGLLASEAFVSFPIVGVEGGVLSVNSHFFEFIDEHGEARLAHQLEKGKYYAVVVTNGGGLYRYQLHDVIEVLGHWKQVPCIRFAGKADHISDWFGEKLAERFVAHVFETVFAKHEVSPSFAMLAPDDGNGFRYTLYVEGNIDEELLAGDVDTALRENFHYDYCRRLGQLKAVQALRVTHGAAAYLNACQARGQKLGNIKPTVLQKTTGWKQWFDLEDELAGR